MSDYRYSIDTDGVIRRGEIQRYGDDDTWRNYWDGDQMIAFTVDWHYGNEHVNLVTRGNDVSDLGERVIEGWRKSSDRNRYLTLAAKVLAGVEPRTGTQIEAEFILVHLDRGQDMYALSWGGDPDNEWRNEIEEVYNHEVYRIVVDKQIGAVNGYRIVVDNQIGTVNGYDPLWLEDESDYTDYYGEDSANEELARQFPLTEYPAEVHVGGSE